MCKQSRTIRRLRWLSPLALLMFAGVALANSAGRTADESGAAPECKNAGVTVSFVAGSADIDTNGKGALAGVATWLKNDDQRTVRLVGYADKKGGAVGNQRLSERRAEAAKQFLLERGIESDRVMIFGHGEARGEPERTGADARVVVVTACEVPKAVAAAPEPEPDPSPPAPAPRVAAAPPPPLPVPPVYVPPTEVPPSMAPVPQRPLSAIGIQATVGGGAIGFIDEGSRDVAGTGGSWDARLMFGSRLPIAVEGAYTGSAQSIEALGLSTSSILLGNGVEGTLRVNLTRARIQPYLFGGAGWTHYQLSNTTTNTSSVLGSDDIGTIPMGAGITGRIGAFVLDARGTYRATFSDDLLRAATTGDNSLQSWNASARLGFEF